MDIKPKDPIACCPECQGFTNEKRIHPPKIWTQGPEEYVNKSKTLAKNDYWYKFGEQEWSAEGEIDHLTWTMMKLDYFQHRTQERPGATVEAQFVAEKPGEEEEEFKFETLEVTRGGPTMTRRGGGFRAFHFGQAGSEGSSWYNEGTKIIMGTPRTRLHYKRVIYASMKRPRSPPLPDEELAKLTISSKRRIAIAKIAKAIHG